MSNPPSSDFGAASPPSSDFGAASPPSSDFRRRQGYGGTGRRGKAAVFPPPAGWENKRASRPKRPNPMFMGFWRF